jgi:hypothetical protein
MVKGNEENGLRNSTKFGVFKDGIMDEKAEFYITFYQKI